MSTSVQVEAYRGHIRVFTRVEMKRGLCQCRMIYRCPLCVDKHQLRGRSGLTRCDNERKPIIINELRRPAEPDLELLKERSASTRS